MQAEKETVAFVSGGSGFVGSYVVEGLLEVGVQRVYVLARGDSPQGLEGRLRALWWNRPLLKAELGARVIPVLEI